jgi:hypothetical protein
MRALKGLTACIAVVELALKGNQRGVKGWEEGSLQNVC